MDVLLMILLVLGLVVAFVGAVQSSFRRDGVFTDASIRYREREELGLSGFGRAVRSHRPRHR